MWDIQDSNLSGNTIDREVAALFGTGEFEGAYVVYRPWLIPLDAAPFEFHGFITEQDVGPEEITVRILQLFSRTNCKLTIRSKRGIATGDSTPRSAAIGAASCLCR